MKVFCPKCRRPVAGEDISIANDMAMCRKCDEVFALSQFANPAGDAGFQVDLNNPPSGAWVRPIYDGVEIGATTRHPWVLFLVPFMIVWSGFSLGGIYGRQIISWRFDPCMSIFGIPFLLGTIVLGSFVLMMICGKTTVTITRRGGELFTGIGRIGIRKLFDPSKAVTVELEPPAYPQYWHRRLVIVLNDRRIRAVTFTMRDERLDFLVGASRLVLRQQDPLAATVAVSPILN